MAKYRNVSGQELEHPPVLGYGDPVKPNAQVEVPADLREQFDDAPAFWARVATAKKTSQRKSGAKKKTTPPVAPAAAGDSRPASAAAAGEQKGDD